MAARTRSKRMSYKQIVHKIIYDAGYASEVADLVRKAKGAGKRAAAARRELESRFEPRPEELADIGLSAQQLKSLGCAQNPQIFKTNDTTFMLLDFARMLA